MTFIAVVLVVSGIIAWLVRSILWLPRKASLVKLEVELAQYVAGLEKVGFTVTPKTTKAAMLLEKGRQNPDKSLAEFTMEDYIQEVGAVPATYDKLVKQFQRYEEDMDFVITPTPWELLEEYQRRILEEPIEIEVSPGYDPEEDWDEEEEFEEEFEEDTEDLKDWEVDW